MGSGRMENDGRWKAGRGYQDDITLGGKHNAL